jgi:starch-binding outer membrane protein, SusD/RagB family
MKTITILRFAFAVLILCSSCDSFVDVDLPSSQLNSSAVFDDKVTANAAMSDIYSKIRDNGLLTGTASGSTVAMSAYTDELTYFGSASGATQFFYNNTVLAINSTVSGWWSFSYNQIYAANAVYDGVEASTKLSQADKQQLMGEALFVRGLVHFYLVNLFGDIPYITTTDYEQNQVVHKMPTAEVYTRIIADLEMAKTLLPSGYFGGTRIRPNKFVASALLARVYLYNGNNAEASNAASAVLNETGMYSLVPNFDNAFLKDSNSTIWQLIPQTDGRNTNEGASFIFNAGPPPLVALQSELMNAFETGDLRKTHWTRAITSGSNTWYHTYKYKQRSPTAATQEYSILFRLPEMYLIRAEARARLGELTNSITDLNTIRSLAGLVAITAVTQQDLLSAILNERRVELFTECGHRFYDLKRFGQINNVLSVVKPDWSATEALLPLPESEVLLNPNLAPQNPGY